MLPGMIARNGVGRSSWADGVLSRVDRPAARLGAAAGMPARPSLECLLTS